MWVRRVSVDGAELRTGIGEANKVVGGAGVARDALRRSVGCRLAHLVEVGEFRALDGCGYPAAPCRKAVVLGLTCAAAWLLDVVEFLGLPRHFLIHHWNGDALEPAVVVAPALVFHQVEFILDLLQRHLAVDIRLDALSEI